MAVDILLTSLLDYLETKKDHVAGQSEINDVIETKKRFAKALEEYIDWRVSLAMEERRKHMSQSRIDIADTINSTVKSTAVSVKSISALNSAPAPPMDTTDLRAMENWKKAYEEWYENKRKEGITIR